MNADQGQDSGRVQHGGRTHSQRDSLGDSESMDQAEKPARIELQAQSGYPLPHDE
jgi:hypothetical protein